MDRQFFDAAREGNVREILRLLLRPGADPNLKFGDENTPLQIACWRGHLDAALALLVAQVDLEARDRDEDTALHLACRRGHSEIVEVLLENGADVRAVNRWNETPLHVAFYSEAGGSEVAKLLLQNGADVNAQDEDGKTPLQRACSESNLQAVELLVQHVQRYDDDDDDVEARSNHLGTALIDALRAETFSDAVEAVAKVLLDSGAKVNV